jgi:hypothetical protein
MSANEHHHLIDVDLNKLGPTQITAGFAEIALKRAEWARLAKTREIMELLEFKGKPR